MRAKSAKPGDAIVEYQRRLEESSATPDQITKLQETICEFFQSREPGECVEGFEICVHCSKPMLVCKAALFVLKHRGLVDWTEQRASRLDKSRRVVYQWIGDRPNNPDCNTDKRDRRH